MLIMRMKKMVLLLLLYLSFMAQSHSQKNENMEPNNPLMCDVETGVCASPSELASAGSAVPIAEKPIRIVYFTDPICSSCWGIEPQLRKLKLEYGHLFDIEYRMGGLLKDWSYNSGGISGPKDVAHHWDEVSQHYDMPIDGDVWLEDPMSSSYPPSIAFKAAQMQDAEKAIVFLRKMRELLFLEKKNIEKWEVVALAARASGLDVDQLRADVDGLARDKFEGDLALARKMGVRGFPSIFISDGRETEFVYGSKPYIVYEGAMIKLLPSADKKTYGTDWESLFGKYPTLTAKEFSVLSGEDRKKTEDMLNRLVVDKKLKVVETKNGNMYKINPR